MINREEYLTIEEEIITSPSIPRGKSLEQLRYIKKRRKDQMLSDNGGVNVNSEDFKLAKLIEAKADRGQKEERLNQIISKIKKMQKKRNITEFSRQFLNQLLDTYCKIERKNKEKKIKEILSHAKCIGDKLIQSKRYHYSGCFISQIEPTQYYSTFYSFL